jgi:ABC-type Fe3+/spermidine/putrescine transport system ATPase subunit
MGQDILLLDEPLSNLDAKLRVEVRTELRQIQQKLKITAIYVTHDQDEALSMSDIIAVMRKGKIEQIGTPWEIYFKPTNRFVADFVGVVNFLEANVDIIAAGGASVNYCGLRFNIDTDKQLTCGQKVTLAVRPECLRFVNDDNQDGLCITGEVVNSSFLGRITRYWVKAGQGILIADETNPSASGVRCGKVILELDANKTHVLTEAENHE